MPVIDIDRRSVAALADAGTYYDRRLTGFGARVSANGIRSYFVEYRPGVGGRRIAKRRMVIGRDGPAFKADAARAAAEMILAKVALGQDPAAEKQSARGAMTVSEIFQAYLDEHVGPKRKPRSKKLLEGYLRLHIAPEIGSRTMVSLTTSDVGRLHRAVGARHRVTANRVISALGASLEFAKSTGRAPSDFINPARSTVRFREARRERFLTDEEYGRLGATLALAESVGLPWRPKLEAISKHTPHSLQTVKLDEHAIAAIRLLILTGARLREILHLRWSEVDLDRAALFLGDSKSGAKAVYLSQPAVEIIRALPRIGSYVFPGGTGRDRPRSDLNRPWARVTAHAELPNLRLHDLRHSFASVAAGANLGLPVIGALLGHRNPSTTSRYAHLASDPLRRANEAIGVAVSIALTTLHESAKADDGRLPSVGEPA